MAVVQAVAVGRFDHNIVRVRDRFRHVADDGLVEIADIAAEHHLALHAVLGHKDLDAGAAEQVAHIAEADGRSARRSAPARDSLTGRRCAMAASASSSV